MAVDLTGALSQCNIDTGRRMAHCDWDTHRQRTEVDDTRCCVWSVSRRRGSKTTQWPWCSSCSISITTTPLTLLRSACPVSSCRHLLPRSSRTNRRRSQTRKSCHHLMTSRLVAVVVCDMSKLESFTRPIRTVFSENKPALPSNRQNLSNDECLEKKREDYRNCSALCCVRELYTVNVLGLVFVSLFGFGILRVFVV